MTSKRKIKFDSTKGKAEALFQKIIHYFGIIFLIAHPFNMKIFLGVYLIFIILLYILYLVLIFNLLVVDFFNISYNLQTNIKYIYIYILLLCLLLLFLKKNQSIVF